MLNAFLVHTAGLCLRYFLGGDGAIGLFAWSGDLHVLWWKQWGLR